MQVESSPASCNMSTRAPRKKALTIGINYIGQLESIPGCVDDSEKIKKFLCGALGYRQEDIVQLTDNSPNPEQQPTRKNIINAMRKLVEDAKPGDRFFFHFSGCGDQVKDEDGDEFDGRDEAIIPVDWEEHGLILDDDMNAIMVKPLPPGCHFTALFDCSHSGSALDLLYEYSNQGKLKEIQPGVEVGKALLRITRGMFFRPDLIGKGVRSIYRINNGSISRIQEHARETRSSSADVVCWSACQDKGWAAQTRTGEQYAGAMTHAFIEALTAKPEQTYAELLTTMQLGPWWYFRKPQLSCSYTLDTNTIFVP